MNQTSQLLTLLEDLEAELKRLNIWSEQAPTQAQLNSQVPFAADVMPFEQWLQFIFIVRLRQLIEHQAPLPTAMSIKPMADVVYGNTYPNLTEILADIDRLFDGE